MRYLVFGLLALPGVAALAEEWSVTEAHFQHGELERPFEGRVADTTTLTLDHSSAWEYGTNYFFLDIAGVSSGDGEVDRHVELYAEWYPAFSLSGLSGRKLSAGPVKDLLLITGLNVDSESDVVKYLPGLRVALDVPGFRYVNADFKAYIDDSRGEFTQDNSYEINVSWSYPFNVGLARWSSQGYVEYVGERNIQHRVFGNGKAESWVLSQIQLRLDLGDILFNTHDQLYTGIEYQYWKNKLGVKDINESAVQWLLVWRF